MSHSPNCLNSSTKAQPISLQAQKWDLRYLEACRVAYSGDVTKARPLLETIIKQTPDAAIRMHATAALINILGFGHHYEEAFSRLDQALDDLPTDRDKNARFHLMGEAAQLLIDAGTVRSRHQLRRPDHCRLSQRQNGCIGMYMKNTCQLSQRPHASTGSATA